MAVKTSSEIYDDIKSRFEESAGDTPGAVLDMFTLAVADIDHDNYQEIEDNKTPHVWTSLEGDTLDATGYWVNLPRDANETDDSYKYRLMQWMLKNEASNETAIKVHLLNPTYAANIEFVSLTNGCGTATCYVLPKHYTEENITASLQEARQRIAEIASPSLYIDYIIPEVRSVSFEIYIKTTGGDLDYIKEKITDQIREYVDAIPPKDYLEVGVINKMGVNTSQVEYFNVLSLYINGELVNKLRSLQEIETKFIFDSITWVDGDDES